MKPADLARKLRREAAFRPAALERGKAVLMAAIRHEVEPMRRATIVPQVPYEDVRGALAFLERADGAIDHATLEFSDGVVGIGPAGHHGTISPKSGGIESQYISVYVDDV